MKTIFSLMLCISLCFSSASFAATTYLVQLGPGNPSWTTSETGFTTVDLTTQALSLNAWFAATTFADGDQVWLINGIYTLTGNLTFKDQVSVYGGFAGNETTTTTRPKSDLDGNGTVSNWEFTNATVIDCALSYSVESPTTNTANAYYDGLTIQYIKCSTSNFVGDKQTMQNCIVKGAIANGTSTMFVMNNTGSLKDCYIHDNNSGTGALFSYSGSSTTTGTVSGCLFDTNTAAYVLYAKSNSNLNVSSSTFSNNPAIALNVWVSTNNNQINVTSCNFVNNQKGAISMGLNGTPSPVGLTVSACKFTNNAAGKGGAIYVYSPVTVSISGSTFTGNSVSGTDGYGGAICLFYLSNATNTIKNCIFTGNTATSTTYGGSAICSRQAALTVNNCVFAKNLGKYVLYFFSTATAGSTFQNCTFASNTNGASATNIYFPASASPAYTFTNSLFFNCTSSVFYPGIPTTASCTYCGFDIALPTYAGTGCITGITSASFKDATNNDWSLAAGSAAINAGTDLSTATSPVTTDILGYKRPVGGAYDMGAYEFGGTPNAVFTPKQDLIGFSIKNNVAVSMYAGYIQVYAVSGNILKQGQINVGDEIKLKSGVYIFRVSTSNGLLTQKIVL